MKKILFFIRIGFQSVFLYGTRDYVKPVSSHEAVVEVLTFPKDLQRYNQKPKFHKERQRIRILLRPLYSLERAEVGINIVYNIVLQHRLKIWILIIYYIYKSKNTLRGFAV
jgi:hypothetical protein